MYGLAPSKLEMGMKTLRNTYIIDMFAPSDTPSAAIAFNSSSFNREILLWMPSVAAEGISRSLWKQQHRKKGKADLRNFGQVDFQQLWNGKLLLALYM